MKRFKKIILLGLVTLYMFATINGCSSERLTAESKFDDDAISRINKIETKYNLGNQYNDYSFTGADFIYKETCYDVGINGIATTTKGKMHYVNMKYKVSCDFVDSIDTTTEESVIEALNHIINEYELNSYTSLEVESIDEICNVARTVARKELNGCALEKSFVYGISDLRLNPEKSQISFNVNQNAKYKSNSEEESNICISQHLVTLYCTKEEYNELTSDFSLVLKTFVSNVKDKKTDKYSITKKYESYEKDFNSGLIFDSNELEK